MGVFVTGRYFEKKLKNIKRGWFARLFGIGSRSERTGEWDFENPQAIWDMAGPSDISSLWNEHGDTFDDLAEHLVRSLGKLELSHKHSRIKESPLAKNDGPYRESPGEPTQ